MGPDDGITYLLRYSPAGLAAPPEGVAVRGHWTTAGGGRGYAIVRAARAAALDRWLSGAREATATPVLDDNEARALLLGAEAPPFVVDYAHVGDAPCEGESLFALEYAFLPGKREEGMAAFAQLTEAVDREDAGANRPLGRWHDLATGTGFAVCASRSAVALQAWAHHWTALCDVRIAPVVAAKAGAAEAEGGRARRWWSSS